MSKLLRKPLSQRPFGKLPQRKISRATPEPSFRESVAALGAVRLPDSPQRVPTARGPGISVKPRRNTPAFVITKADGRVVAERRDLTAEQRRALDGTPTGGTCDLHRHTAARAREKVRTFLLAERSRGRHLVLVIVGKGRHSPGERPILRDEISDWLTTPPLAALVLAFRTAPPRLGGEGGLVILLARRTP